MINVASCTLRVPPGAEGARARALGAFNAVQGFGSIFGPLLGASWPPSLGTVRVRDERGPCARRDWGPLDDAHLGRPESSGEKD